MLNPTDFANADSEVDKNHRAESKNSSSKGSALVTYTLKLDDKEKILKALELLDTYLSDYYLKNSEDNEYTLEKLDILYGLTPSIFGAEKEEHINKRNTTSASYWKLVNAFSDDEKQYFSANYLHKDSADLDGSVVVEKQSGRGTYIKYVLIGVLLTGFIAAGVICCIYIFDGTVKTANELVALGVSVYGVKIGAVGAGATGGAEAVGAGKKRGTALDRWLQGLENISIYNNTSMTSGEGICDVKSWDGISNVHISDNAACLDRDSLN